MSRVKSSKLTNLNEQEIQTPPIEEPLIGYSKFFSYVG